MPDLVHGAGAVELARTAVAAESRHVPALADPLDTGGVSGTDGLLAGALADAVDRLREALAGDLTAAGRQLDALERALDATRRSVEAADHDTAASWRAIGPSAPPGR